MKKPALTSRIVFVIALVVIVTVWELITRLQLVSPLILPRLEQVVAFMFAGLVTDRIWWRHVMVTLMETFAGFSIGVIVALALGGVLAFMDTVRHGLHPFILGIQTFPKVAIAPLLMTWLGYGLAPKVALAAFLAFFPVYSATVAGLTAINADQLALMRMMEAKKWHELRHLRLPNAMSYVIPSLDVALVLAFLGALVGELVSAREGLGYQIALSTAYGEVAGVYGVLILLSMLGMFMHLAMSWLTNRLRYRQR
jgi:NitT/TauT family transport system permease protein